MTIKEYKLARKQIKCEYKKALNELDSRYIIGSYMRKKMKRKVESFYLDVAFTSNATLTPDSMYNFLDQEARKCHYTVFTVEDCGVITRYQIKRLGD